MTDYFALLGFERHPWLEADEVKARFLRQSAEAHPDRIHQGSEEELKSATEIFAQLNAAATMLRSSKERLQHLLALEGEPVSNTSQISGELMDLFWRVGQAIRDVDAFLVEKAKANSPMVQAQLFPVGLEWSDRIAELQGAVTGAQGRAEAELREISASWPANKSIDRLKSIAQTLAVTGKWEAQLKERFAALAVF